MQPMSKALENKNFLQAPELGVILQKVALFLAFQKKKKKFTKSSCLSHVDVILV